MIRADIDGREFLLGLVWYDLLEDAPKREITQRLKENEGARYGVVMHVDAAAGPISSLGVVPGDEQLGRGKRFTLAGSVARQENKALLLYPISESLWWGCAIAEGAVMRGGDFYGDPQAVTEAARGFLQSDPTLPVCGTRLEELGFDTYEERDLSAMLADPASLVPVGVVRPARVPPALTGAATLAALVVAGYITYQWFAPSTPKAPTGPTPAQRARMRLQAYLHRVDRKAYAGLPSDTEWVRALAAQLNAPEYPLFFHGWRLIGAKCSVAESGCSLIWQAYGPGNVSDLSTRLGRPYNTFQVNIDGTTAQAELPFSTMHPPVRIDSPHSSRGRLKALSDQTTIANRWAESMRALHLQYPTLQWSGGAVTKLNGINPAPPGLPPHLVVGHVAATGQSQYTLHRVLDDADRLGLLPVVYNYAPKTGQKAGWKVEFKYVAKS